MFVFSEQKPWQDDAAVQQILVFPCDKAKEDFEEKFAANLAKDGVEKASDTGIGAIYKLRGVLCSCGAYVANIRCGITGYLLWESHDRFVKAEEAIWAAFSEMKKSILRARSQSLYDAVKKRFTISGYLNQIKTKQELKSYRFCNTAKPKVVSIDFTDKAEALKLFELMQSLNITSFKNWVN